MTNLQPGTADWECAVAEGIAADSSRAWALGDIALALAPMGEYPPTVDPHGGDRIEQVHEVVLAHLARYAQDIGVDAERLYVYRQVAAAWPPAERLRRRA